MSTIAVAYTDGKAQTPVGPRAPLPVVLSAVGNSSGGGGTSVGTIQTTPYNGTITATVITLTAAVSEQLVAANPTRKGLRWMNIGLNPMTVVPGASAAVVGQGMAYSGASSAGQQGGSETFEGSAIPTNAFQAISTLGTTVIVWETN